MVKILAHPGTAYEILEAELRANITNGRLAPGSKICPENQLAEQYAISRGTVRVALENLVRDGLLRKVRGSGTFVTDPGDRPDAAMHKRQILFLSFATALSRDTFFSPNTYLPMLSGMTAESELNGCNLLVSHIGTDWEAPPCLNNHDVAGIIFHGPVTPEFYQRWIAPLPNVAIQYLSPDLDGHCVKEDNAGFSYQAVKRLKDAGCRRIGFVSNEIDMPVSLERYYAFRMALKEFGLPFHREHCAIWQRPFSDGVLLTEPQMPDYRPMLAPLFAQSEKPDALICVDDWRARCTIAALDQMGMRVPEDLCIIGGNNGYSQLQTPLISGFDFRLNEVCAKAVWLLFETIGGKIDGGVTLQIRPKFIEGTTIAPRGAERE